MKKQSFDELEFYMLSNIIIDRACKTYTKIIGPNYLPYTFVEFYFKEVAKFNTLHSEALAFFFANYKFNQTTIAKLINVFSRNFPDYVRRREFARTPLLTNLKPGQYLELKPIYTTAHIDYHVEDPDIVEAIESIRRISERLLLNNEVSDLATQFKLFEKQANKVQKQYSLTDIAQHKNERARTDSITNIPLAESPKILSTEGELFSADSSKSQFL